jgi:hypothetical protein
MWYQGWPHTQPADWLGGPVALIVTIIATRNQVSVHGGSEEEVRMREHQPPSATLVCDKCRCGIPRAAVAYQHEPL